MLSHEQVDDAQPAQPTKPVVPRHVIKSSRHLHMHVVFDSAGCWAPDIETIQTELRQTRRPRRHPATHPTPGRSLATSWPSFNLLLQCVVASMMHNESEHPGDIVEVEGKESHTGTGSKEPNASTWYGKQVTIRRLRPAWLLKKCVAASLHASEALP